ncbi:hypothetical protein Vafri_16456, partial [Volvox africanus]
MEFPSMKDMRFALALAAVTSTTFHPYCPFCGQSVPGTARPAATVNALDDTVTTPAAANGSAMGAARAAAVPASPVPVTPVPVVPAIPDTVASTEAGPSTLPSAASREEE